MIGLFADILTGLVSMLVLLSWGFSKWKYEKKNDDRYESAVFSLYIVFFVVGIGTCLIDVVEMIFSIIITVIGGI